jgi:hypothetical protein
MCLIFFTWSAILAFFSGKCINFRSNNMAKKRTNIKSNQNFQSGNITAAPAKAESIKVESKPIDPANDPIVNLFKPKHILTYEQIAERAKLIWQNRGCISGEDERNWHEAESQLRKELGIV